MLGSSLGFWNVLFRCLSDPSSRYLCFLSPFSTYEMGGLPCLSDTEGDWIHLPFLGSPRSYALSLVSLCLRCGTDSIHAWEFNFFIYALRTLLTCWHWSPTVVGKVAMSGCPGWTLWEVSCQQGLSRQELFGEAMCAGASILWA